MCWGGVLTGCPLLLVVVALAQMGIWWGALGVGIFWAALAFAMAMVLLDVDYIW